MLLNFGGRKRSGAFDTVWPSARSYEKHVNLQMALRAACFCAVTHSCLHCASLPLLFLVFFFLLPRFCFLLLCLYAAYNYVDAVFLLSCLLDDAWCPVPAVCLLGALSSQNSTCVSEGEVARRGDRLACCLYAVFPLVFNLGDFKKPGQVQRNPPQNKKKAILAPIQIEGFRSWLLL